MYKTPSGAFLVTVSTLLSHVVLEPEHLAYLLFVETDDDFAVNDGSRRRLRVDLDHLLHGFEVGANILLDKIDVSLR